MPEEWRLIFAPAAHAFMNMAIDEAIAKSSAESKPTIRFYTWGKPAVSIGYFQRIVPVIDWLNHNPPFSPFDKGGIPLYSPFIKGGIMDIVRRPTGGGVILHSPVLSEANVTDLTYSVAIKTLTSTRNLIPLFYKQLGQAVIEGLRLLGINAGFCTKSRRSPRDSQLGTPLSLCAQTPVEFDVLVIPYNPPFNKGENPPQSPFNKGGIRGIKVAGCAARRFRETLLFQGYVSIPTFLCSREREEPPLHPPLVKGEKGGLHQVIDAVVKGFALALNIELVKESLTDDEIALAEELNKNKYSRNEWNYKR